MVSRTAVTAALAAATYALMWAATVRSWTWVTTVDDWALVTLHTYALPRPQWVSLWGVLTDVLSPNAMRVVALVGIVAALIARRRRIAAFLTVSVMLMGLVTVAAKALADRPRPGTALAVASSSSFPSGHALGGMVAVLAFVTVAWPMIAPRMRAAVVVAAVAVVVVVGVSRVVLNVHHPSDVLAGWALGYLWYLLCVRLVSPYALPSGG